MSSGMYYCPERLSKGKRQKSLIANSLPWAACILRALGASFLARELPVDRVKTRTIVTPGLIVPITSKCLLPIFMELIRSKRSIGFWLSRASFKVRERHGRRHRIGSRSSGSHASRHVSPQKPELKRGYLS